MTFDISKLKRLPCLLLVLFFIVNRTDAQSNPPLIEIESNNSGILISRMSEADRLNISDPTRGLLIYQVDGQKGFYYFEGPDWKQVGDGVNGWYMQDDTIRSDYPVQINTASPSGSLDLEGSITVGHDTTQLAEKGTIRFNNNNNNFEGFDGDIWRNLYNGNMSSFIEDSTIVSPDAFAGEQFGLRMAQDDNVLAISARNGQAPNGVYCGAVYVFKRLNSIWEFEQKLTPSDPSYSMQFGSSVDVSGDLIAIGAESATDNGFNSGAIYVFRRAGSSWNEVTKLIPSDGDVGHRFGFSVACQGDVIIGGAPFDESMPTRSGSAYIFEFNGTNWIEIDKLIGPNATFREGFGRDVDYDNGRAIVAAPFHDIANIRDAGEIYVYQKQGLDWVLEASISEPIQSDNGGFGRIANIDGDYIAISLRDDDEIEDNSGAVYIFKFSNGVWNFFQKIKASDTHQYQGFGSALSMKNDKIVVGASGDNAVNSRAGAVYYFRLISGEWKPIQKYVSQELRSDSSFPDVLSIGNNEFFGSLLNINDYRGSVYVFELR